MVEAAVGKITVDVGVEEVVALPVELEETVEFEVVIGCNVVNTDVATDVLPLDTNVERDVMTASDCEGDCDDDGEDEVEFVEF